MIAVSVDTHTPRSPTADARSAGRASTPQPSSPWLLWFVAVSRLTGPQPSALCPLPGGALEPVSCERVEVAAQQVEARRVMRSLAST
jgi:hypothetical protein